MREFQVRKKVRDIYGFADELFFLDGNVIFVDQKAARLFTHSYNLKSKEKLRPAQVYLLGLIDEILHYVCSIYVRDVEPNAFYELSSFLKQRIGSSEIRYLLDYFLQEFPPPSVYSGKEGLDDYMRKMGGNESLLAKVLEETLMLWLANMNPAFGFLKEVFDDEDLRRETSYLKVIREMKIFFEMKRPFGPRNQSLFDMLRSPAEEEPYSLEGQLRFILENWGYLLGSMRVKIKEGLDSVKEERVFFFPHPHLMQVPKFEETVCQPTKREEKDWMRDLVLIAKHTYVWLDQLSRLYGREIKRLNEIPDEELRRLKDFGITGIWLIGLWERSPASKRIKNLSGNLDAIASAYSIYDYEISEDLGGKEALSALREKASRYGIRLGCDMVPNHFGIYSRWMIERPEWLIFREDNPYPWYTYSGENLSLSDDLEIYLEDHYYDRTDAAVVCKRVDRKKNEVIYVYHGNDGTGMPWNDTVQINYLIPEVRKEMIKTIIRIAKEFPIIRFDAAMTLTKMHYQRLWFPEPGKGGAIPTRSEFSMPKEEFDRRMPKEFWREVVEEVENECKDTLLLAEAFWLLENYFVKTLGMHRVYNSAFMIMLRDEKNMEFKGMIKEILETDPYVLGKLVNFMSNPDERTAYDQFGDGEKYFGVCTLMCTLPGLPMFGHGQIENFKEKYGMEFFRAYLDEKPDESFLDRHKKEIFPILKKRRVFSGTENFYLFDFYLEDGRIDENVFAFYNRYDSQFALVFFNNSPKWTKGRIGVTSRKKEEASGEVSQRRISDILGIEGEENDFILLKDIQKGREILFEKRELNELGIQIGLGPYDHFVFMEIEIIGEGSRKIWRFISERSRDIHLKKLKVYHRLLTDLVYLLDKDDMRKMISEEGEKKRELVEKKLKSFRSFMESFFKLREGKVKGEVISLQEDHLRKVFSLGDGNELKENSKGGIKETLNLLYSRILFHILSSIQSLEPEEYERMLIFEALRELCGVKEDLLMQKAQMLKT